MKRVSNLSIAWLRLVAHALATPGHEILPAVATIECHSLESIEQDSFRLEMDRLLNECRYGSTETVASTIFPSSLWNRKARREDLFDRYFALLPIIRKHNPRGVYFERLMSYPGSKGIRGFNQLEHVIRTYAGGNHRRSALQASIVDPRKDLTSNARVLGFPCLHQVGFLPDAETGTMSIVAYYPMQYLVRRAYGNYLGLIRLGHFMAHEMGFTCNQLVCIAGVGVIEKHTSQVRRLVQLYSESYELHTGHISS